MTKNEIAKYIDQTLLSACATEDEIKSFCQNAKDYHFASVCVNPQFVPLCAEILKDSDVKVCTVIDFPLGSGGLFNKQDQADRAICDGAGELDFVVNLSLVKAHKWNELRKELSSLIEGVKLAANFASEEGGKTIITKLILETCYLTDEEIVESCKCAKQSGFDFVKTSTGFGTGGATLEHVKLMKETVGSEMSVKASGGIRDLDTALEMISNGASRIGTSAGCKIVDSL